MVTLIAAAGFALTVLAAYPGYMTNDATYVHSYIESWSLGDWQSPLMTILWWLIDPVAPGGGSMFLFVAALYWLGFGLTGIAVARRSLVLGVMTLVLGVVPPAFMLLTMIWRDVLFAALWLVAAAIVYVAAERRRWRVGIPGCGADLHRLRNFVAAECDHRGAFAGGLCAVAHAV